MAYAESVPAVRISEDRVVVGEWSNELIELAETECPHPSAAARRKPCRSSRLDAVTPGRRAGYPRRRRRKPGGALSLTAMDERGRPGYLPAVVDHLPTETLSLSQLLAPSDARHMRFNTEILRVMSPDTFCRAVDETLDPIAFHARRSRVSWEWLEAVISLNDVDRIAELLYRTDESALEDAFLERIEHFDMHAVVCGISAFRLVSETSAGTMLPPIDDAETRQVTEAIHRAVPELLNKILRAAWERRT